MVQEINDQNGLDYRVGINDERSVRCHEVGPNRDGRCRPLPGDADPKQGVTIQSGPFAQPRRSWRSAQLWPTTLGGDPFATKTSSSPASRAEATPPVRGFRQNDLIVSINGPRHPARPAMSRPPVPVAAHGRSWSTAAAVRSVAC